jgi:hypothetical protein
MDGDIDATKPGSITTGGLTALGDTIVVAIVDDGLDYNHEDIAANAWINHHEIDGNGLMMTATDTSMIFMGGML